MIVEADKFPNLAAALAKAQGEIEAAEKDRTNPAFRSKYATLASIRDAMRDPFARHGLSVTQAPTTYYDNGQLFAGVVSTLRHESGEAERSRLGLPVGEKVTPQACGSAITYARRYALAGIAGVCPDDDDGHSASRHHDEDRREPPRESPRQSQRTETDGPPNDPKWPAAKAAFDEAWREYDVEHRQCTERPASFSEICDEMGRRYGFSKLPKYPSADLFERMTDYLRKATEGLEATRAAPAPEEPNGKSKRKESRA